MKNKTSLILMELLVMVLVFALAAALCLRLFAGAALLSAETERQDRAVLLAQNAAEALKAGKQPVLSSPEGDLTLTIREGEMPYPDLKEAEIAVFFEENLLYSLTVGCREVAQ